MSVVNGLYYQQLKSTVSLPSITGSLFYFTLPWYPQSYIDEVRFWNTSGTACTVTAMLILNDGAHYRNSSTDNKGQLIYRDPTDKQTYASDAYFAAWELTPAPYSDNLYNRPFLNVLIATTGSTTFTPTIQVIGRKALGNSYVDTDSQGILVDKSFRVLIGKGQSGAGGTGGTIYDITSAMSRKGGPNANQAGFTATTDYLYVGSEKVVDHFEFNLSGTGLTGAATLSMQFWNGSTWSATGVSIMDNTSSGNSDTMRFSGIVENNGTITGWKKTRLTGTGNTLPLDPVTGLGISINDGQLSPIGQLYDPDRYWWRFSVSSVTGSGCTFASILPLNEAY